MESYCELAFDSFYYKKAFDSVSKKAVIKDLEGQGIGKEYLQILYEVNESSVAEIKQHRWCNESEAGKWSVTRAILIIVTGRV